MKLKLSLGIGLALLVSSIMPVAAQTKPESNEAFALIDELIEAEVMYGLSGAQLVVMHKGEVVKQNAYGYTNSYENIETDGITDLKKVNVIPVAKRNPVTNDTLFDLASNTKMYAGNYAIQYLISHTDLSLDTRIVDIFPEYQYHNIGVDGQSELNIGHLLRHDSGFIASPKYHDNTFKGNLGNTGDSNYLYTQNPDEILEKLLLTPLEFAPGTKVRYSDVDFMLIGKIVEAKTGKDFDVFLQEEIYGPLGLDSITFNPLDHGFEANDTSSSELHGNTRDGRVLFNNYRSKVITGEVHDEKAFYTFDGIAGHAGLFGNATDIASLAQLMLDGGTRDGINYFTQETIDTFMEASPLNDTYGYGWRRQGQSKAYGWAFSPYASVNTIGHTGWTGTITQIDPDNELVIALFTNARNSPIMGPDKNDFYTKAFRTNDYGTITTLVYEGLGLGSDVSATDFITQQIEKERASGKNTASNRNEMRALYTVLKNKAHNDKQARDYIMEHFETDVISKNDVFSDDTLHLDLSALNTNKDVLKVTLENAQSFITEHDQIAELVNYAEMLNTDITATQASIDAIVEALNAEVEKVQPKPVNREQLDTLMQHVKLLTPEDYTKESFSVLLDAYKDAEAYLTADQLTQEGIDAHVKDLQDAIAALVKKDTPKEDPTTDTKDDETDTETETKQDDQTVNVEEKNNVDTSEEKPVSDVTLPATGYSNTSIATSLLLMSVGIVGVSVSVKRRRA